MKKITLSDFSRGMMQRVTPDDHLKGELGYTYGFVPEDNQSIRSQWPIQSIGGESREWVGTDITISTEGGVTTYTLSEGSVNTSDVLALYPLNSTSGVYLIALKEDGTIWWTKAPEGDATHVLANSCQWTQLVVAENRGFSIYEDYNSQPFITIESNPDYRFVTELSLEVYKYIKRPQYHVFNETTPTNIDANGSHGGHSTATPPTVQAEPVEGVSTATYPWYLDFTKDALPDANTLNDETGAQEGTSISKFSRSIVSGVLLHSRRYYKDGRLTRTKDYATRKTVTAKESPSGGSQTLRILTVGAGHGFSVNDFITIDIGDSNYDGFHVITATTSTTISYLKTVSYTQVLTNVNDTNAVVYKYHRNQTAVVAYVDPYTESVKVVTFPNFRRWPMYAVSTDPLKGFSGEYRPMQSWVVKTNKTQGKFPFIAKYPYASSTNTSITAHDIEDTSGYDKRSAYPKYNASFHPYTYLDKNKTLLPGRGFVPRCFTGTMLGNVLILGDIEWKSDSAQTPLSDKRLTPEANTVAGSSANSNFGLRDENTEPHRGFFYYSQDDIDVFDPRSVLRASGTDTRIASMHSLNNRVVAITSGGGPDDGVITFTGNFGQLHPYQPGVLSNPLAVRKEIIGGGLGTADTDDYYNHGNPQSVLWGDKGVIAFIDKSGYVYITNGQTVNRLSDRYPDVNTVTKSTVNDHVAAVGNNLFIYKNNYLYCYTTKGDVDAWSILHKPNVFWDSSDPSYTQDFETYNVIKSMRGINNELYLVVHTYSCQINWKNEDKTEGAGYIGEPVRTNSRIMRYALSGPSAERGSQDGEDIQTLFFATPALGVSGESKKVNWHSGGLNFFTENTCKLYGVSIEARYTPGYFYDFWGGFNTSNYFIGTGQGDYFIDPSLLPNYPLTEQPFRTYNEGYHNFEFRLGLGPQKVISVGAYFTGDVRIEGVNIWFTGSYNLVGMKNEQ